MASARRMTATAIAIGLLAMLGLAAQAGAAVAPGFTEFSVTPSETQAGGHPDVDINLNYTQPEEPGNSYQARRIEIHWPRGFIGNPHVAPTCTLTEFNQARCPVDAQVGRFELLGFGSPGQGIFVPIYNMETNPDQAGLLAFTAPLLDFPVFFELSSRTDGDYGLEVTTTPTIRLPFTQFKTTLWGVPADPKHDVYRFQSPLGATGACYEGFFGPEVVGCPPGTPYVSLTYAHATAPPAPFLDNPTTCGEELTISGDVEYFGDLTKHAEAEYPATTGCQQMSFSPSLVAKPTTAETDTSSGLDTDLIVPQTQSPVTPSPSELKTTTITLPQGFTINPNAADGKLACPEDLDGIGTLLAADCPEYSKIGSLELDVAALPAPIPGAMYLLPPKPGERFRVLIAADGFATHVKIAGVVRTDPQTGQLTIAFEELPQSPLQEFNVHIFGSERGLFATPDKCGTYPVKTSFVPWNDQLATRELESFMTFSAGPGNTGCVGEGETRNFSPRITAGSENSTAGAHSSFDLTINRDDGDQNLSGVTVKTPPGFSATLAGIPYCPQSALDQLAAPGYTGASEQASPACPAASQVGSAAAGVGSGTHPLYVNGKVYLAGPYKGAPLSLEVVLPALSGPYDLGVVPVRVALRVDHASAQVTAISDPLPQILEGVPLRTRYVRIDLDRQGFALNPTNCDPFAVQGTLSGSEGSSAGLNAHYQATNCANLPYEPNLSLRLTGGVQRRGHPAIHATFSQQPGEANSRLVQVALPAGEQLDQNHVGNVCTRPLFAAGNCPASSAIGTAEATTPLLEKPLKGSVYLRTNPNRSLPDVVADLKGQLEIELSGRIDKAPGGGGLRTTFEAVPDVPVSSFKLDLLGGGKGLLINSKTLCGRPKKATTRMVGQNGATVSEKTKLHAACGAARHKRHAHRGKARG